MIITFLPSLTGDCMVIELDDKRCILVDCGYHSTYTEYLKPLLIRLRENGKRITLMIVTHIDRDHIEGAIDLLNENGKYEAPKVIPIDYIWFNGFKSLVFQTKTFGEVSKFQMQRMRELVAQCEVPTTSDDYEQISSVQAKCFEMLCAELGYEVNTQFHDRIVKEARCIDFDDGLTVDVLSPTNSMLCTLARYFENELYHLFGNSYPLSGNADFIEFYNQVMLHSEKTETVFENISGNMPQDINQWIADMPPKAISVPNQASIVLSIQYKGKSLLLCGDANFSAFKEEVELRYDVIKLSHHASWDANVQIWEKTRAKHYLVSTNGNRSNHPSKALLAKLLMLPEKKHVHFNYEIPSLELLLNVEQQGKYNFSATFGLQQIILGE